MEFVAIRSATVNSVTQTLKQRVILRYGTPQVLLSDNGPQYTSKLLGQICKDYGIKHNFTPPYTPQANPGKRTNKVIEIVIAQCLEETQKKWDVLLPEFMFAYNTSVPGIFKLWPRTKNPTHVRATKGKYLGFKSPEQGKGAKEQIYWLVKKQLEKNHMETKDIIITSEGDPTNLKLEM